MSDDPISLLAVEVGALAESVTAQSVLLADALESWTGQRRTLWAAVTALVVVVALTVGAVTYTAVDLDRRRTDRCVADNARVRAIVAANIQTVRTVAAGAGLTPAETEVFVADVRRDLAAIPDLQPKDCP